MSWLKNVVEVAVLILADIVCVLLVFKLSVLIREKILPLIYSGFSAEILFRGMENIWWVLPIWVFFFFREGLYSKRFIFWDEIRALWKVSFFSTVAVFAIVSIGKLSDDISRTVVFLMGMSSIPLLPLVRMQVKRLLRLSGLLERRVIILGAGEMGKLIARALRKESNYGYKVIGFLEDDPEKIGTTIDGIKVHRGLDSATKYIRRCKITDLIIAMPDANGKMMRKIVNSLHYKVDRILFIPDIIGMAVGTRLQHFFGEQTVALEVNNNLNQAVAYFTKRAFDYLVGAILFLILLIPLMIIAALVKATSLGPAFFEQERMGKNGRLFKCYKFRTMHQDAVARLNDILESDPKARAEWGKYWKLRNDPRVTWIGRFLRETSLDELPQIINVLKGEMSL
ncbi:MAG: sugar transferase, partial [Nitrospirota bacterium]